METRFIAKGTRRDFLRGSGALLCLAMAMKPGGLQAQSPPAANRPGDAKDADPYVSPVEDLMQEHAVLSRILLIYEDIQGKLRRGARFPLEALTGAVRITRRFVEDYHEKLEEEHLFPRFSKAAGMPDLVKLLLQQHQAGRRVTDYLLSYSDVSAMKKSGERKNLAKHLGQYVRMYRPHASREATVLFPAFRSLVRGEEYHELGERFEELEHARFGDEGFSGIVAEIAELEKALNIYDLAQFSPVIK
jgi:hemerythrin-like domain-containing protein